MDRLAQLAADASAYLRELRDRDVPYELAELLVRDWHTAKLQTEWGFQTTPVTNNYGPHLSEQTADAVLDELRRLGALGMS